ncbi:MAG TPA: bifunctional hydroxymethylpyrimidine kinase/phosphomethylpyrimidine kinase [Thermoanaerobaculia bacterium]|nr:bifunctional hydroxymethylpyrimidine kinase/phosphomethylpyrimidine kinase [Thermoanaerobaculia bacterium]
MPRVPPRLLTIAGSDSGGGAGIQADLKTFAAHGAYGMSAITALTAQNTREVRAVHAAPPDFVAAQIDAVFEDIGVDAVKIGMLADAGLVRAVADRLRFWMRQQAIPIVLDPVMIAKSGDALLRDDAVEAVIEELVPLATLVTPNLPELERLTGLPTATEDDRRRAAEALLAKSAERTAVLAKGGHADGPQVVDLLLLSDPGGAGRWHRFTHPRLDSRSTHGTGCTLSSAIAARLARGEDMRRAVEGGIEYLQAAMAAAYPVGQGHGPVDHLYQWRERE